MSKFITWKVTLGNIIWCGNCRKKNAKGDLYYHGISKYGSLFSSIICQLFIRQSFTTLITIFMKWRINKWTISTPLHYTFIEFRCYVADKGVENYSRDFFTSAQKAREICSNAYKRSLARYIPANFQGSAGNEFKQQ